MFSFYILNILIWFNILFCASLVIFSKNPIHSVIFLIICFFNSVILLLTLNMEFLAMIFLIIYVGAIAVLFLFVLMMLNIRIIELTDDFYEYIYFGIFFSLGFFFIILELILNFVFKINKTDASFLLILFKLFSYYKTENLYFYTNWSELFFKTNDVIALSSIIYVYYYVVLMLIGLILLIAMLGSIFLTLNSSVNIKRQQIFKQISRDFNKITRFYKN